jgi:DNA-binding transcriptional LysR family regulator
MIDKLDMFIALAAERHFGRAAEVCGVTQPSLSSAIRQLEDQLGVQLVYRGSRFQGLTPEGQRVLDWARRISGDMRSMKDEMRSVHAGLPVMLRLGVIPTALAMVAGPMAGRLAARIDRTRAQWAASLGRPEHASVREMELLERAMTQADRLAGLGLSDADMLATGATLARWAAWSPSSEGVAVTLAPLRPRISLACAAAAEGEWDECARTLEAVERELPLAEFVAIVQARIGASLPRVDPGACALIRSLGTPTHDGSWLAADRARLATLARAWRELRHATSTGAVDQGQACAAVASQVARDLIDSLVAIGPDTVEP